ncbi:hypothetical protein TrLO_g13423 [Triparma laevis f. longispina]|nr:hypothetical protein TrLO_g13423 [Triparma laevis f. longispina]
MYESYGSSSRPGLSSISPYEKQQKRQRHRQRQRQRRGVFAMDQMGGEKKKSSGYGFSSGYGHGANGNTDGERFGKTGR